MHTHTRPFIMAYLNMCIDALAFFANCRGQLKLGDFGLARLYHADDKRYLTFIVCMAHYVPYSRKYWRALNLAVEPKIAIARILANLNLAVRYGIAIRTYASRKFWRILIWRLQYRPPNRQI